MQLASKLHRAALPGESPVRPALKTPQQIEYAADTLSRCPGGYDVKVCRPERQHISSHPFSH